ncbi:hypothetical protein L6164_002416 [Bauhinia variegata]|uniref:Uncharacterized protein n=1 Tax=Bauhinia variegata TaxID=167791 RepID=A0ACB9PY50_BAUVA|nr:hypothetical protein L6164_002416 [Bauhinia variegata]
MGSEDQSFALTLDCKSLGLKKKVFTRLRFYWHDTLSGSNPTSVTVFKYPQNSTEAYAFGFENIFDNPITQGPEPSSKLLGRSQGFYFAASKGPMSLFSAMNVVFTEGKYNGSTITILGRNPITSGTIRELPVIGGNGVLRFAIGYAQISTYWFDNATKDAIVEYNVYVKHYGHKALDDV